MMALLRLLCLFYVLSSFFSVQAFNNFTPKVEWKCLNTTLSVKLITSSPFFGIVHPTGNRNAECVFRGTGGAILEFKYDLDPNRCNVHYDKKARKYRLHLELHEHKTLILNEDQSLDIECHGAVPPKQVAHTAEEIEMVGDNMTESMENLPAPQLSINFDLELISRDSETSTKIAQYGQPYNLRVSIHEPIGKRFRVHSCHARAGNNKIELISSSGCSLDKNLIEDFVYWKETASAKIRSLFRFPDSQTIQFECSLKLCVEDEECKPNCALKLDDPEDPELVSKLLHVSFPEGEELTSGNIPSSYLRRQSASTEIHIVDRREPPNIQTTEATRPVTDRNPINITGCRCDVSDELVLLYKVCLGLSLLFALGCCCNVMFCCLNVRGKNATKKRRSVPKIIAQNTLTRNQYWINEPITTRGGQAGNAFEEFPAQYTEMQPAGPDNNPQPKRNSLTSYASLRPRPKNIDHSVNLIGYHQNGQANNNNNNHSNTGFQYDTNATSVMSALNNYNANRNSPPRSSGYEVPNSRTFHSGSNSASTPSPRNSLETTAANQASTVMTGSTTSATAVRPLSPQQFLTLSDNPPAVRETYSIL